MLSTFLSFFLSFFLLGEVYAKKDVDLCDFLKSQISLKNYGRSLNEVNVTIDFSDNTDSQYKIKNISKIKSNPSIESALKNLKDRKGYNCFSNGEGTKEMSSYLDGFNSEVALYSFENMKPDQEMRYVFCATDGNKKNVKLFSKI